MDSSCSPKLTDGSLEPLQGAGCVGVVQVLQACRQQDEGVFQTRLAMIPHKLPNADGDECRETERNE